MKDGKGRMREKVGVSGLYIFSFFSLLSVTLAYCGIVLMAFALALKAISKRRAEKFFVPGGTMSFAPCPPTGRPCLPEGRTSWPSMVFSPLAALFVASVAFIALEAWRGASLLPGTWDEQLNEGLKFARLWLFLLPAVWIDGREQRALISLLLCLAGLVTGMLLALDQDMIQGVLSGERTGFHLRITPFGLYSATSILGLILFWPRIGQGMKPLSRMFARTCAALAFLVLLQGLIATQARGAWLALSISILVIAVLRSSTGKHKFKNFTPLVIVAVTLVLLNFNFIKERVLLQIEEFRANREYAMDQIPSTGIGHRLHLYAFAISKWREHPLLGWGAGSTERLIAQSGREDLKITSWKGDRVWFDHLHSLYFELLVRFGLMGLLLFGATAFYLLFRVWKARPLKMKQPGEGAGLAPAMSEDIWLFTLGVFIMAAVWNLFDFRLLHWDWRFYWMVAWGSGFGLVIQPSIGQASSLFSTQGAVSRQ